MSPVRVSPMSSVWNVTHLAGCSIPSRLDGALHVNLKALPVGLVCVCRTAKQESANSMTQ